MQKLGCICVCKGRKFENSEYSPQLNQCIGALEENSNLDVSFRALADL